MKRANETKKTNYVVNVMSAKEVKEGRVAFNMEVNGVQIYGCWYTEYTTKEGKGGTMISFPSYKGNNDKWYSHAWLPINAELKEEIVAQIEKLV